MDRDRERDLRVALAAALEAGRAAAGWYGGAVSVRHKTPDQPLTEADLEADQVLRVALLGERPEYGWLSEETADAAERLDRERVWIVDPLDGTQSFIAGEPEFAVSVGLAERGDAVLGVVYNPVTGEVYWAVAGEGAWLGRIAPVAGAAGEVSPEPAARVPSPAGASGEPPAVAAAAVAGLTGIRRLAVRADDSRLMVASRSEIAAGELEPFRGRWRLLPLGSTAYKLARVAEGGGEAFVSRGPKSEWDVCAGGLLVSEAGGRTTDLRGEPLRYNRPDPAVYGVLATNGRRHEELLAQVAALPAPRLSRPPRDPLHPGLEKDET